MFGRSLAVHGSPLKWGAGARPRERAVLGSALNDGSKGFASWNLFCCVWVVRDGEKSRQKANIDSGEQHTSTEKTKALSFGAFVPLRGEPRLSHP